MYVYVYVYVYVCVYVCVSCRVRLRVRVRVRVYVYVCAIAHADGGTVLSSCVQLHVWVVAFLLEYREYLSREAIRIGRGRALRLDLSEVLGTLRGPRGPSPLVGVSYNTRRVVVGRVVSERGPASHRRRELYEDPTPHPTAG